MRRTLNFAIAAIVAGQVLCLTAGEMCFSFDDTGETQPVKSRNVDFVKGLSGRAAHLGRDSVLEYAARHSGFMTATSGTFMAWLRFDNSIPCGNKWRDRDRDDKGNIKWIVESGSGMRTLFSSGGVNIVSGLCLCGNVGPSSVVEYNFGRRVLGGEWHFVAVSYDAGTGSSLWFADGVMVKSNFFSNANVRFGKTFTLGCGRGTPGLEGAVDEVRFLPVALGENALRKEYLKWQPIRYELQDWSVCEGETRPFRLRARNESPAKVEKTLNFSNGATVALSLAPNELKEFTVDVKGGNPGLFRLWLNEGEPDARQFECICLERESLNARNAENKKTLIGEYDCTKTYPVDRVALCDSEVVTNGALAYLESRDFRTAVPLAAYRFEIRHQGRPHIVELDYPDDRTRTFLFGVYPEKWGRLYTKTIDCAGIMTGADYPLSMGMQTKRLMFWPDSPSVSVVVQNFKKVRSGYGSPPVRGNEYGEYPAACAAVRLYEMDALPSGPVQGMSPTMRSVAEWDEDPTIDADLSFSQSFNFYDCNLEFWKVKWQRVIDYMQWNSMDSWIIKTTAYFGDSTAMDATIPEAALPWDAHTYGNGRCRGWAELGADMLSRAGMGFWIRINHRDKPWFRRLGGDASGAVSGKSDIRNPVVRQAYLRLVAAYRDKFGNTPAFRGITMNEAIPMHFPGGEKELADFAAELVRTLRANGGNAEVQIWIQSADYCDRGNLKWEDWDAERKFREAGVDLTALSKIPGVRPVPCVRPDWFRSKVKWRSDEPYFQDSPSWVRLMRQSGIEVMNVHRQSNLEIYPKMGLWEATANPWRTEFWLPTFNVVNFEKDFQCYPTPHARPPYTLDSVASLVADCDIQDLLTGFWGMMSSGEHDEWRRFYGQFRRIPRGRYELAKGPDDPVGVRSGADGHYLVNREPYPVTVEYIVDGMAETAVLERHEIRFVKGRGACGNVRVDRIAIPEAEKARHLENLKRLESGAKSAPDDAALVRAAKEARAAFESGRFRQFRTLFSLGAVRKLMHPELFVK